MTDYGVYSGTHKLGWLSKGELTMVSAVIKPTKDYGACTL